MPIVFEKTVSNLKLSLAARGDKIVGVVEAPINNSKQFPEESRPSSKDFSKRAFSYV